MENREFTHTVSFNRCVNMQIEHGKGCGPTGDACDSALCTCIIMNLYKYVNDICLEWSWDTMQSGPEAQGWQSMLV